jgi:DNA-binding transcriptional ArsR family regulator
MATISAAKTTAQRNGLRALERKAAGVAGLLGALANERRLMILCRLVEWGEGNVGSLADAVGLSQSALSQHLARMRQEGLVAFRRDGQTLWYRIADSRVEELFATLHRLFCRETIETTTETPRRRK